MGMGAAGAHGWIISTENLRGLIPTEYAVLEAALDKRKLALDDLALAIAEEEDLTDDDKEIDDALDALYAAFKQKTAVDGKELELELFYYSDEDGDIYDDLEDGANWSVDGMWELTPPGKKFKDIIEQCSWTQFG